MSKNIQEVNDNPDIEAHMSEDEMNEFYAKYRAEHSETIEVEFPDWHPSISESFSD